MIRKPPLSNLQLAALGAPVVAILILLVFTIGGNVAASREAKRVNQATEFVDNVTVLVHELQEERDRSAGQAASGRDTPSDDLVEARQQADQAADLWRDALGGLPRGAYGKPLRDALDTAGGDLGKLGQHRQRVDAGELPKFLDATKFYIDLVGHLLVVVDRVADETTDPDLRTSLRTVSALAWSKENASQERGLLNWMLTEGADGIQDEASQALLAQMSGAEFTWLVQFRVAAPKAQEELFEQVVSGNEVNQVGDLRARAISQPDRLGGVKPATWMDAATTKADLMREVEQRLVDKAKADGASARSGALKGAFTGTFPTLLALLIAAGGAFLLARSFPQAPAARGRPATDDGYEPARWPEEPAARLGGDRATEVIRRPYDQSPTGPQPAYGARDPAATGPQPAMGPAGGWPGSGPSSGGWPAVGAVEGPSGQWPAMRDAGVADDQSGPGTGSWPGMTAVGRPPAAAPGGPPNAPWKAAPPGTPPAGAPPHGAPTPGGWAGRDATGPTGWRPGAPQARPEGTAARSWTPPPTPGAPGASGAPAGAPGQPAGGGLPRRSTAGERLPIFEETRYDWFRTGGSQAAGTRRGAEDLSDLIGSGDPSRLFGDPAGVSDAATSAGLPRRRQGASLAAGLASGNGTATTYAPSPLGGSVRSPEDLRAALDSYQSGFERGKQEAMRWFKDMPGGNA